MRQKSRIARKQQKSCYQFTYFIQDRIYLAMLQAAPKLTLLTRNFILKDHVKSNKICYLSGNPGILSMGVRNNEKGEKNGFPKWNRHSQGDISHLNHRENVLFRKLNSPIYFNNNITAQTILKHFAMRNLDIFMKHISFQ